MVRRTLQFVLMLAVLVSAPAAQVSAMPCCEGSAAVASAHAHEARMHCHGDMEPMSQVMSGAVSLAHCDAPTCRVPAEATATGERVTSHFLQLPITVCWFATVHSNTATRRGCIEGNPPPIDRRSAIPLRV